MYVAIYVIKVLHNRVFLTNQRIQIKILHTWWINSNGYDDSLTSLRPYRNLVLATPIETSGETSLACR
jgi:hypothetical protein